MNQRLASTRTTFLWIAAVAVVVIWALRDLALLVGYAVLLAYALLPVVSAIERIRDPRGRHLPRGLAAAGVMLVLVAIVGWLLALAVPRLVAEAAHFASGAPEGLARLVETLRAYGAGHGLSAWLDPAIDNARANASGLLRSLGGTLAVWIARAFGSIGQMLGLALIPLLAFYLLADSAAVRTSALRFVPEAARPEVLRLGGAVDRALRSYVRGQAIVCLVMGVAVGIGLTVLHHPVALLLGLLVGAAEIIPYLGFMVAAVAIAVAGMTVSPAQALFGVAVYVGLNWVIGTFVTPRVMGRYLKMHPFVVTVSVLAGAELLGPAGALLALPGAAVLQAVVDELTPPSPPAGSDGAASGSAAGA